MKNLLRVLSIGLIVTQVGYAQSNEYVVFTKAKKLPQPIFGMSYAANGQKAILAGGRSFSANSDEIYVYDSAIDEWLNLSSSSPLKPTLFGGAVYLEDYGSVLFAGGTTQTRDHVLLIDNIQYYDMKTFQSSDLGENPIAAKNQGLAYANDKVYIFGGSTGRKADKEGVEFEFNKRMYVYNLKTGLMQQLSDMPEGKETKGCIVAGTLYTLGGYGEKASDQIHAYDIQKDKWSKIGRLKNPCSAYALVQYQQYIFLIGDYKFMDQMVVFDTKSLKTKTFKMNFRGRHMGAAVLEGELNVFGGFDPEKSRSSGSAQHWKLDLDQFFKYNY